MRLRLLCLLAATLVASAPAFPCKELVRFPEHLTGDSPTWFQAYRVITVLEVRDSYLSARVVEQFGGRSEVGTAVTLRFIVGEEPHAMCPTPFYVGETYLMYATANGAALEISRFNWMNVPRSHPNFNVYVADLKRASAAGNSLQERQ